MPRCLPSDAGLMETVNFTAPPTLRSVQPPLMRPPAREPKSRGLDHVETPPNRGQPKLQALTINFQFKSPGSFPRHWFCLFVHNYANRGKRAYFQPGWFAGSHGRFGRCFLWAVAGRWAHGTHGATRGAVCSKPQPPRILTNSRSSPEKSPLALSGWPVGVCTPNSEAHGPGGQSALRFLARGHPCASFSECLSLPAPCKVHLETVSSDVESRALAVTSGKGSFSVFCP